MYKNSIVTFFMVGMVLSLAGCLQSAPKKKDELEFCLAYMCADGHTHSICGTKKAIDNYFKREGDGLDKPIKFKKNSI